MGKNTLFALRIVCAASLAAGCSYVVEADRSKIADDLYHPTQLPDSGAAEDAGMGADTGTETEGGGEDAPAGDTGSGADTGTGTDGGGTGDAPTEAAPGDAGGGD